MRDPNCIELDKCIDGNFYRIRSRNLSYGVYSAAEKGFVGVREKFASRYLFTEYHWDTGAPFGTASPLEDLGKCPVEGELNEENTTLFNWIEENYTKGRTPWGPSEVHKYKKI